jgi:hypothetical protein
MDFLYRQEVAGEPEKGAQELPSEEAQKLEGGWSWGRGGYSR